MAARAGSGRAEDEAELPALVTLDLLSGPALVAVVAEDEKTMMLSWTDAGAVKPTSVEFQSFPGLRGAELVEVAEALTQLGCERKKALVNMVMGATAAGEAQAALMRRAGSKLKILDETALLVPVDLSDTFRSMIS